MKKYRTYIVSLPNKKTSMLFGAELASACQKACVIYLYGDLGVGKTTFCQGFLYALGHVGSVKSPTYLLVESYLLSHWTIYHFDLYRLNNADELNFMGARDFFNETALCLIEWPQRGKGVLPTADISLTLYYYQREEGRRQAEIQALSITGASILDQLSLNTKLKYFSEQI